MSRLLDRIEAADAGGAPDRPPAVRWLDRFRSWGTWLVGPPSRVPRWALAAQGALIVILVAAVGWQATESTRRVYRTLETGDGAAPSASATIRVVFVPDLTEQELRALLVRVGGSIIAGPSTVGVYTVRVAPPGDAPRSVADAISALRVHPGVRLAEPTTPR